MKIGEVLRKWRRASDIGVREAAQQIGINVATLSRIENGETMDGTNLAQILVWLMSRSPDVVG